MNSQLIQLPTRQVNFDNFEGIYSNGADNYYSETIEALINNSVTAKRCSNIMSTYIGGKGFKGLNYQSVGNISLGDFTRKSARSVSRQRGAFFLVNYDLNFDISSVDVLPYHHCRIGKKDDDNYNGKILVSKDWTDTKNSKPIEFDVFNGDKKVFLSQLNNCAGDTIAEKLSSYKGQVLYLNLDFDSIYASSTIDAVRLDCDSEFQSAIYRNNSLRKGFFGKTMIVTKPLVGEMPQDGDEQGFKTYNRQISERDAFRKQMQSFIGVQNNEGIMHTEMEYDEEEGIESAIKFINIDSNLDDKGFEYTEKQTSENIMFAHGIPMELLKASSGVFGNSGELIKQMKLSYQEQISIEQSAMVEVLKSLLVRMPQFTNKELTFTKLVEAQENETINQ